MNLSFSVVGEGPPLIILHGLLGSADNWRSMSRRLCAHYQVFALDLRNHGRSPPSDILDYDIMAADVREFMEQQALRRIMLKNLTRDENGRLGWKIHLEAIDQKYDKLLRGLATEQSLNKPALFIRGGRSNHIEDDDTPLIRQMFTQR